MNLIESKTEISRLPEPIKPFSVRLLTDADKPAVLELWRSRASHLGVRKNRDGDFERFASTIGLFLSGGQRRLQVGAFEGDQLRATLGLVFWESHPFASFVNLIVHQEMTPRLYRAEQNGLQACRDATYLLGEERGVYQYYALTSLKKFQSVEKFRARTKTESRYLRVVEAVIPAGCTPRFLSHFRIMTEKTWDMDLVIFADILKPEYRQVRPERRKPELPVT